MSEFATTLTTFCDELRLTFPELPAEAVVRARTTTASQFWVMWRGSLSILIRRDAESLLSDRRGLLVGAVQLTPALWAEISPTTRGAIWSHLRTLTLQSALDTSREMDERTADQLMELLLCVRSEDPTDPTGAPSGGVATFMAPLLEKLKGLVSGFMDVSAMPTAADFPEIPERLRTGRIARLAEELASQFNPEEFGLTAADLSGDNIEVLINRLMAIYEENPVKLQNGIRQMAEKMKRQILGGSLNRDELIAEAKEFMELFKNHPKFKDLIDQAEGLSGFADLFGGSSSEPSERRRAVQERLRKKHDARKKKAAGR